MEKKLGNRRGLWINWIKRKALEHSLEKLKKEIAATDAKIAVIEEAIALKEAEIKQVDGAISRCEKALKQDEN